MKTVKTVIVLLIVIAAAVMPVMADGAKLSVTAGMISTGIEAGADFGRWSFDSGVSTALPQMTLWNLAGGEDFPSAVMNAAVTGIDVSAQARYAFLCFGRQRISAGIYASMLMSFGGIGTDSPMGVGFPSTGLSLRWEGGAGTPGGLFFEMRIPIAFTLLLTDFTRVEGGVPMTLFQTGADGAKGLLSFTSLLSAKLGYTWRFGR